jgi:hypothetical protein
MHARLFIARERTADGLPVERHGALAVADQNLLSVTFHSNCSFRCYHRIRVAPAAALTDHQ